MVYILLGILLFTMTCQASLTFAQQGAKSRAFEIIEANKEKLARVSDAIFSYSEPSFQEVNTVKLLVGRYRQAGFRVETGVAGMPTAFVGVWGSGKPIIALMSDYDAQLTSSQKPGVIRYDPLVEGAPGHGEGHNTNPVVVYGAALALKAVMQEFGLSGTLKVIGGPAEESIASRGFMVKAGVWDDVDVGMDAHIARGAGVKYGLTNRALLSVVFTFNGEAEEFPYIRNDALAGLEMMISGIQRLKERIPSSSRIQYIITEGGVSPNVKAREASLWAYLREKSVTNLLRLYEEAKKVAEGAALMSGTRVEAKIRTGTWPLNQNKHLTELTHKNMVEIGLPKWSEEDHAFFKAIQRYFHGKEVGVNYQIDDKLEASQGTSSSDAGDVTWVIPSTRLTYPGQAFIRGEGGDPWRTGQKISNHQWTQAVTPATPIAHKGLVFGAKVMAATFIDILLDPEHLKQIRADFQEQTKGYTWKSLIPDDVKPPLDVNKVHMDKYRPLLEKFYYDPESPVSYLETLGIKYQYD